MNMRMWHLAVPLSLFLLSGIGFSGQAYAGDLPASGSTAPFAVDVQAEKAGSSLTAQAEQAPPRERIILSQTDSLPYPILPQTPQTGTNPASQGTGTSATPPPPPEASTLPPEIPSPGTPEAVPAESNATAGGAATPLPPVNPSASIAKSSPPESFSEQSGRKLIVTPPIAKNKQKTPVQVMVVLVLDVVSLFMNVW
jgi:hypothetical protein